MIRIFNTLKKEIQDFIPLDKKHVKVYVCGPTVYDKIHIGNARPLVVFDVLVRLLKSNFEKVTYVRNITDVDDKINNKSSETGIPINELTKETIKYFHNDCLSLQNILPDVEPKATDHINDMIDMIKVLIEKDFAYESSGNVLFKVNRYKDYGLLSKRTLEEMIAGSRVEIADYKENPGDFILWKPSSNDLPGWVSPWGRGRPGWHIECSAMSKKYLGKTFDIHGGGIDLVFPHHENEIAQSCCANNSTKFANYWLHNGYVTFNKEKMSKSLGNIVTIEKMRKTINGQVIRLALLSSHYKQPLDWNENLISESQSTLDKWYTQYENTKEDVLNEDLLKPLLEDINTPGFIAKLHLLFDKASKGDGSSKKLFLAGCKLIGLLEENVDTWNKFKKAKSKIDEKTIVNKIKDRDNARKKGDYKLADNIRKELESSGVSIEDKGNQTIWKYK